MVCEPPIVRREPTEGQRSAAVAANCVAWPLDGCGSPPHSASATYGRSGAISGCWPGRGSRSSGRGPLLLSSLARREAPQSLLALRRAYASAA